MLAYGLGSAFVPLIGSVGLEVFGSPTLPALLTLFNLALVALAVIRLVKRRRLPVVEPVPFAPLALPQVVATRDSLLSVEEDTTDPQAVSSTRAARGPS